MHYKRRGHNRLTISDILYNKNGELLINPICATSLPLTRQEISKQLHYHAPESIIVKTLSKSMKNDVWAMGCIAILMLTSTGLYKSDFHPYNLSKFSDRES
jgi:serine/threonine protein kinase